MEPGAEKLNPDGRMYIAIDLKSFYASVECAERGLDPLRTHLVVADASRTSKTICLAVSPSLKSLGVSGRARLFEVVRKTEEINRERKRRNGGRPFSGSSYLPSELSEDPSLALDYVTAVPRMSLYMEYSTRIYDIYLRSIAPEDIHVYSIDEVFIDATSYLKIYGLSAHELALKLIREVLSETGITATAGVAPNLYLAKIAMDIVAKHMKADKDGVRIAELDELSYRRQLWTHRPLTDFWRVGRGYVRRLESVGLFTMGDIARCSLGKKDDYYNEDLLFRLFGVNAELLIDHAWGYEPATIADIRAYKPESNSLSSGQVLTEPYTAEKGRLIVREMTELLVLDLVSKNLVTDQLVLTVGYDVDNLSDPVIRRKYKGPVENDYYGRPAPKRAHGSVNLGGFTSSTKRITEAMLSLYDRIVHPDLFVRRMYVVANHVITRGTQPPKESYRQLDLFTDLSAEEETERREKQEEEKELRLQKAVIDLQKRYGKNAVLKGMNFEEGAMTVKRNEQIGGHKA